MWYDGILDDEDITWAVLRLRMNFLGSPSGMREEHIFQWMIAVTQDNSPEATNWLKVVTIAQAQFRDETLGDECTW